MVPVTKQLRSRYPPVRASQAILENLRLQVNVRSLVSPEDTAGAGIVTLIKAWPN